MAGTMLDVKNYFEYTNIKEFAEDWRKLTEEDKTELKEEVGKIIGK